MNTDTDTGAKASIEKLLVSGLALSVIGVHLLFGFEVAVLTCGVTLFCLGLLGALR